LEPHATGLASLLAPLAVIPETQNQGIGGKLIKQGLQILSERGVELARYRLDGNPTGLTWDGDHVWYNDYTWKKIRKVKPPR